jgi:hypothetical protein
MILVYYGMPINIKFKYIPVQSISPVTQSSSVIYRPLSNPLNTSDNGLSISLDRRNKKFYKKKV